MLLLIYYLYKNITDDMCHHVFMYDGRDKISIHKQMIQLNIYQTHMD